MAKKKQSKPQQQSISPVRFLKERVRQVPVYKCYLSHDFEKSTEGTVMVVRKHTGDKYTCGLYLVDKYCLGVKDASYHLRLDESEFEEFLDLFEEDFNPHVVTYEEAHNWVWGAVGFAEDAGIAPCKEFDLAQYVLAEDDDEVELIKYDFGDKDGKHCLLANDRLEASTYLPLMHKNLGDDYTFCLGPKDIIHGAEDWDYEKNVPLFDDSELSDADWDIEEDDEVEYHQVHPEYPTELNLKNCDIAEVLSCSDPKLLAAEDVDAFISREGIKEDLEQYILYHIGQSNDDAYAKDETIYDNDDRYECNLMQAVRLLAEIGDEQSLDVVLEVLRQDSGCLEYHFGDYLVESVTPAVAKLCAGHLDKLMSYAKEPGLYDYAHNIVLEAVGAIWEYNPELRENVKEWFKEVLTFAKEKLDADDKSYFSHTVVAFALVQCMNTAEEDLLPIIKELYEKDYVNQNVCGTYVNVAQCILTRQGSMDHFDMDIQDWFEWYYTNFGTETK